MENRLNSMPPSQRQQYQELMAEQQALQQESKRFEDATDELDRTLATLEGELARNPLKQRSLQLQVGREAGRGCSDGFDNTVA